MNQVSDRGTDMSSERSQEVRVQSSNNFNFIRLVLASSVIVSHSAEFIHGGSRDLDPLNFVFRSGFSLGDLAVNAFYMLSGFLIVKSWMSQPQTWPFLQKRILRIYPAFIVASLLSEYVVGPLGGNPDYWADYSRWRVLRRIIFIGLPGEPDAFPDLAVHAANGALDNSLRVHLLHRRHRDGIAAAFPAPMGRSSDLASDSRPPCLPDNDGNREPPGLCRSRDQGYWTMSSCVRDVSRRRLPLSVRRPASIFEKGRRHQPARVNPLHVPLYARCCRPGGVRVLFDHGCSIHPCSFPAVLRKPCGYFVRRLHLRMANPTAHLEPIPKYRQLHVRDCLDGSELYRGLA